MGPLLKTATVNRCRREQVREDFAHIRLLGANTVRVYVPAPKWFLDEALEQGLFVFIDIPWEKHRCFFEDWQALECARAADGSRIGPSSGGVGFERRQRDPY